ncbi:hypothetical protein PROFUN_13392 [Planoprotostelium fungivorum]|uniref:ATP-dependent RNA helicase n=1 Tax=Planoprotostelium fungivorum TaxID=1890364 RepID=A0A2P6MZT6_9EUKA|nr:hypothetical protein PROFUN_13392 [Planoprotostelium fungivorum]
MQVYDFDPDDRPHKKRVVFVDPMEKLASKDDTEGFYGFTNMEPKQNEQTEEDDTSFSLPLWMKNPNGIADVKIPVTTLSKRVDPVIMRNLGLMNITEFFPVQRELLPLLFRPRTFGGDVCVAAPTGSGKTLTYVIPIVQNLLSRVVMRVRAVIVVPTKDLVRQVRKVFKQVAHGTDIRVQFLQATDNSTAHLDDSDTQVCDILVCTPDGLVQKMSEPTFDLQHLRYLVLDEADQLLDGKSSTSETNWIEKVISASHKRETSGVVTIREKAPHRNDPREEPLFKILLSATMTKNPAELSHLQLVNPQFYSTSITYTLPPTLKQYVVTTNLMNKPLVLLHMLMNLEISQALCFCSSIKSTHKLYLILRSILGEKVAEFSSHITTKQRKEILRHFAAKKIQIIICSDVMSRGMDLEGVTNIIQYDLPNSGEIHVHRSGRTARAGKKGTNYNLISEEEQTLFDTLLTSVKGVEYEKIEYGKEMENLRPLMEKAGKELGHKLLEEKRRNTTAPRYLKKIKK